MNGSKTNVWFVFQYFENSSNDCTVYFAFLTVKKNT